MLLNDSTDRLMGGQRKELTILFSDIVSFTTLCEGIEPEIVQKVLQEYFNEMTRIGFGHQPPVRVDIGGAKRKCCRKIALQPTDMVEEML